MPSHRSRRIHLPPTATIRSLHLLPAKSGIHLGERLRPLLGLGAICDGILGWNFEFVRSFHERVADDVNRSNLGVVDHGLFGCARDSVPVYSSSGFTSLTDLERQQLEGWQAAGCTAVEIEVGGSVGHQRSARRAPRRIGEINRQRQRGRHGGRQRRIHPRSSCPARGHRRHHGCDVVRGTLASNDLRTLASLRAVDCLQVDVTRCAAYTQWSRCAALAAAQNMQVSGHCAPALHASVAIAVPNLRHVEWSSDHAKREPLLVDNVPQVRSGRMDLTNAPVHGMSLRPDAEKYRTR